MLWMFSFIKEPLNKTLISTTPYSQLDYYKFYLKVFIFKFNILSFKLEKLNFGCRQKQISLLAHLPALF